MNNRQENYSKMGRVVGLFLQNIRGKKEKKAGGRGQERNDGAGEMMPLENNKRN